MLTRFPRWALPLQLHAPIISAHSCGNMGDLAGSALEYAGAYRAMMQYAGYAPPSSAKSSVSERWHLSHRCRCHDVLMSHTLSSYKGRDDGSQERSLNRQSNHY
jgi:hypothetical protein